MRPRTSSTRVIPSRLPRRDRGVLSSRVRTGVFNHRRAFSRVPKTSIALAVISTTAGSNVGLCPTFFEAPAGRSLTVLSQFKSPVFNDVSATTSSINRFISARSSLVSTAILCPEYRIFPCAHPRSLKSGRRRPIMIQCRYAHVSFWRAFSHCRSSPPISRPPERCGLPSCAPTLSKAGSIRKQNQSPARWRIWCKNSPGVSAFPTPSSPPPMPAK